MTLDNKLNVESNSKCAKFGDYLPMLCPIEDMLSFVKA